MSPCSFDNIHRGPSINYVILKLAIWTPSPPYWDDIVYGWPHSRCSLVYWNSVEINVQMAILFWKELRSKTDANFLVNIYKIFFGSKSTFNFEALNSITIVTLLLCFFCKRVCQGKISKTNKNARWNILACGILKIHKCADQNKMVQVKINKPNCTSIWYARVLEIEAGKNKAD